MIFGDSGVIYLYNKIAPLNIKNNLKRLCESHGITLTFLAQQTGVDIHTIYNWDESFPNVAKLMKIADYFNITLDDILIEDRTIFIVQKHS